MGLRWIANWIGDVELDCTKAGAANAHLAYRAGSAVDLVAVNVVNCNSGTSSGSSSSRLSQVNSDGVTKSPCLLKFRHTTLIHDTAVPWVIDRADLVALAIENHHLQRVSI
jgi:hypothetical protein